MTWVPIYTISDKLLATMRAIGEACGELNTKLSACSGMTVVQLKKYSMTLRGGGRITWPDHIGLIDIESESQSFDKTKQMLFQTVRDGTFELDYHTFDWLLRQIQPEEECQNYSDNCYNSALTSALIQFINQQMGVIDPVILAGIFYRQATLLRLDRHINNQVTHLLTGAILSKSGMQYCEYISINHYCQLDTSRYLNALRFIHADPRLDSGIDLTQWLEFYAEAVLYELRRIIQHNAKRNCTKQTLDQCYRRIIKFMERNGSISPQESYVTQSHDNKTLRLYLDNLVKLGLIEPKGQGQGVYYVLT